MIIIMHLLIYYLQVLLYYHLLCPLLNQIEFDLLLHRYIATLLICGWNRVRRQWYKNGQNEMIFMIKTSSSAPHLPIHWYYSTPHRWSIGFNLIRCCIATLLICGWNRVKTSVIQKWSKWNVFDDQNTVLRSTLTHPLVLQRPYRWSTGLNVFCCIITTLLICGWI